MEPHSSHRTSTGLPEAVSGRTTPAQSMSPSEPQEEAGTRQPGSHERSVSP